jgi:hypothetical protein
LMEKNLVCASCGEPIEGPVYEGEESSPVHVHCRFPESCPVCGRDLWEDGFLWLGGRAWHAHCESRTL